MDRVLVLNHENEIYFHKTTKQQDLIWKSVDENSNKEKEGTMEKLIPITTVNEIDREKPYTAETFREVGVKKLAHLTAIKELMESEGYAEKRKAFEEERDRLFAEIDRHTSHIGEWEEEMTQKIMEAPSLSDEEKGRKMQDEVYGKIEEMHRRAESNEEYRKAIGEYRAFLQNNELMEESTLYNLKRTSPESMPFVDLAKTLAGEETEEINCEMPSDCIYDQIKIWEKYVESGYLDDYKKAVEEDERDKKRSALQLNYLFSECDEVCFYAEENISFGDESDDRFAKILEGAVRTEKTENYGMNVLCVFLKPTQQLKDYLLSFKRFDRYHYDAYERYAPYFSFADIRFLKNGQTLLSCLTHEGYFDVSDDIKPILDGFEEKIK